LKDVDLPSNHIVISSLTKFHNLTLNGVKFSSVSITSFIVFLLVAVVSSNQFKNPPNQFQIRRSGKCFGNPKNLKCEGDFGFFP